MLSGGERAFAYAKACGIIGKSFVGKRLRVPGEAGRLQDLDRLVFRADSLNLPERELLSGMEKRLAARGARSLLSIITCFSHPPAFLVLLLRSYEYQDLKAALAAASAQPAGAAGEGFAFTDIGRFGTVRFDLWPDIPKMIAGTEFAFLLDKRGALRGSVPEAVLDAALLGGARPAPRRYTACTSAVHGLHLGGARPAPRRCTACTSAVHGLHLGGARRGDSLPAAEGGEEPGGVPLAAALDRLYYRALWDALQELPRSDRRASERLLGEEISLLNAGWALRLRAYYEMSEEEVKRHLVSLPRPGAASGGAPLRGGSLADEALACLGLPLDIRAAWNGWCWERFLNPETPGEPWRASPRRFQNAAAVYLYEEAKAAFRLHPFSLDTVFCFARLKQFEADCLISRAEGLSLGLAPKELPALQEAAG
ncbi:MAG: V/A type ATP synthase; V/A-type H+/Na+-transporting ATPase subunit C [Treponematales bacterium]